MVLLSAIPSTLPSDLRRQLADQLVMRARVDLTLEQLRGRGDRDLADLAPQALAGAGGLESDLLLRRSHQALTLLCRGAPRLLDDVVGPVLRLLDDLAAALACLAQDRFRAVARLLQLLLAAIRRGKPLRDLALALFDGAHQDGPALAHRDPDEQGENDHLDDEGEIDVHALFLNDSRRSCSRRSDGRGSMHGRQEGIREHEEEREGDADEGHGVEQGRHDEHSDEQSGGELGLARHALEETAAEDTEADGGAERSHAENQSACKRGHRFYECNVTHSNLRWVIPDWCDSGVPVSDARRPATGTRW